MELSSNFPLIHFFNELSQNIYSPPSTIPVHNFNVKHHLVASSILNTQFILNFTASISLAHSHFSPKTYLIISINAVAAGDLVQIFPVLKPSAVELRDELATAELELGQYMLVCRDHSVSFPALDWPVSGGVGAYPEVMRGDGY